MKWKHVQPGTPISPCYLNDTIPAFQQSNGQLEHLQEHSVIRLSYDQINDQVWCAARIQAALHFKQSHSCPSQQSCSRSRVTDQGLGTTFLCHALCRAHSARVFGQREVGAKVTTEKWPTQSFPLESESSLTGLKSSLFTDRHAKRAFHEFRIRRFTIMRSTYERGTKVRLSFSGGPHASREARVKSFLATTILFSPVLKHRKTMHFRNVTQSYTRTCS